MTLDIQKIRADFPVLEREVHPGVKLAYLDSGATSQKPSQVIDAISDYNERYNANVHRGIHTLAEEATAEYEGAREKIATFINAASSKEVIYTRNATESINLVAQTWGEANIQAGDVIVLTEMEHHANLVPWQMLAAKKGATLEFIEVTDDGLLDLEKYPALLALEPKLVAFTQQSNVLGTVNPIVEMTAQAKAAGATVLIDGSQGVPHTTVDVQAIGADFYAFTGHKMLGPTGIGILWGKEAVLAAMPPWMGGGDMIKRVYLREFKTADLPHKFEAGTPAITQAIGLGAAVDYLSAIGMENVHAHEVMLRDYMLDRLAEVPGLRMFGPEAEHKGAVAAFDFEDIHPHDIAQILDEHGVAVRAGHHCAMPLHDKFDLAATARASLYLYNTTDEIDTLVTALYAVKKMFG